MLPFWLSIGVLSLLQALLVALPRPARWVALDRLRSGWWALWLPLPLAATIGVIALDEGSADFFTWLALIGAPPLAAISFGWLIRGSRAPLSLLAIPVFALAWAEKGTLSGDIAALLLTGGCCIALAWLLVCVVPTRWLKLGIYAMAIIDAYLIGTDLLQEPNNALSAASPAADLPRLQLVHFSSALMGFGDLFIAATLGALLANQGRRAQLRGALVAAVLCPAWDLLFFWIDETPATVPIALTLVVLELWGRWERRPNGGRRSAPPEPQRA